MELKKGSSILFRFGKKIFFGKKTYNQRPKINGVELDPEAETADINLNNNSWPEKNNTSDFDKFKEKIKG